MAELKIDKYIQEMSMKATENTENFIFEIIRPYCEEVSKITVSKEYLKHLLTRSVPLSVIEDIKADIEKVMRKNNIGMAGEEPFNDGCKRCLKIIDKHISGKEQEL